VHGVSLVSASKQSLRSRKNMSVQSNQPIGSRDLSTAFSKHWHKMDDLTQEELSKLALEYAPRSLDPEDIRQASLRFDQALIRLLRSMPDSSSDQTREANQTVQDTASGGTESPNSKLG
jgi:hypothetical protein